VHEVEHGLIDGDIPNFDNDSIILCILNYFTVSSSLTL
jgi:hypothetical protein